VLRGRRAGAGGCQRADRESAGCLQQATPHRRVPRDAVPAERLGTVVGGGVVHGRSPSRAKNGSPPSRPPAPAPAPPPLRLRSRTCLAAAVVTPAASPASTWACRTYPEVAGRAYPFRGLSLGEVGRLGNAARSGEKARDAEHGRRPLVKVRRVNSLKEIRKARERSGVEDGRHRPNADRSRGANGPPETHAKT